MQSLLLVLFGWLLGLLAPAIQGRIRRKYRAGELRNAITVELNELMDGYGQLAEMAKRIADAISSLPD